MLCRRSQISRRYIDSAMARLNDAWQKLALICMNLVMKKMKTKLLESKNNQMKMISLM